MSKRIITSVIAFPIFAIIIGIGGILLQLLVMLLSLIGAYELFKAVSKKILPVHYITFLFIVLYCLALPFLDENILLLLFPALIIGNLIFFVIFHEKVTVLDLCVSVFGFFYVGMLISFIYLTRMYQGYGVFIVWLIFISAWGSDTFAYFTGMAIGKHKLTPKLSPKKTIEGSIGGVVGALVIGLIYSLAVIALFPSDFVGTSFIYICLICSGVGAIFSQFGDIAASTIKRGVNIKDYGKIIPGHGGVLDRFDSILFTAPGVYIVLMLFSYFVAK